MRSPSSRARARASRWTAEARLRLVQEFQARSGSFSETFFDAHDLGAAYRSVDKYSSKQSKINAALHRATGRGDLEQVLDAAVVYLKLDFADLVSSDETDDQGDSIVTSDKLFISHAHADKDLASLLHEVLVLGGVPSDRIFYSSQRGTGIPTGADVRATLHQSLTGAGLVIELLTKTFFTRPMCLMELGGAWALETPTYPIVVPPLTRAEAIDIIGNLQMGVLDPSGDVDEIFDELQERVAAVLGITLRPVNWRQAVTSFKRQLPTALASGVI